MFKTQTHVCIEEHSKVFVHVPKVLILNLFLLETQRDIHQRATGELEDAGLENVQLR